MSNQASDPKGFDLTHYEDMLAEMDWINLCEELRVNFTVRTSEECARITQAKEKVNFVCKVLDTASVHLSQNLNDQIFDLCAQCYRVLRNMSAFSPLIQTFIASESTAFDISEKMLNFFQSREVSIFNQLGKCYLSLMQFIGNNTVQNSESQNIVWKRFEKQILSCLKSSPEFSNVAAMILYNIILGDPDKVKTNLPYILTTLESNSSKDISYTEFIYEYYITNWDKQLALIYGELPSAVKLLIYDITKNMIQDEQNLSPTYLQVLSTEFKIKSDCILKTVSSYVENIEPQEVVSLLNVLASATGMELYRPHFREDKSLFINCAFLLRAMHSLGKEGENNFTSIQRLADLAPGKTDVEIEAHVAYGFKGQLIRIIGNLMYRNPTNQNQIREIDCIGVLLDCCNMDARNPLIMQWVILAIRNLCEDCPENQAIILQMRKESPKFTGVCDKAGIVG